MPNPYRIDWLNVVVWLLLVLACLACWIGALVLIVRAWRIVSAS